MTAHHNDIDTECANCGTPVIGEYCYHCGQKARQHKDSFFHMVTHFVADYFHYDHKFLQTLKLLITRPGKLSREYMSGKRASYLHPIQLYIFVSAVFFLLFFMSFHINTGYEKIGEDYLFSTEYVWGNASGHEEAAHYPDTTNRYAYDLTGTQAIYDRVTTDAIKEPFAFTEEYGWTLYNRAFITYTYNHRIFSYAEGQKKILETFFHSIPKLFFIMMPLFALLLQLFFGRRREMQYVDHAVMSLHFHSFAFISCIAGLLVNYIPDVPNFITILFGVIIPGIYFLFAAYFFYRRHFLYTIIMGSIMWVGYVYLVLIMSVLYLFLVMMF